MKSCGLPSREMPARPASEIKQTRRLRASHLSRRSKLFSFKQCYPLAYCRNGIHSRVVLLVIGGERLVELNVGIHRTAGEVRSDSNTRRLMRVASTVTAGIAATHHALLNCSSPSASKPPH